MRLGIIGTGRIAGRFVREAGFVGGIDITAVYNPHDGSAQQFVDAKWSHSGHDVKTKPAALTELETFWELVNAVYIATPHETHFEYARRSLSAQKHVLCEKPLSFSETEAEKLFELSSCFDVVLLEGIKTAYCPGFVQMMSIARSGVIGAVRDVEACFTRLIPPTTREFTNVGYGGSFTEYGSYTLLPMIKLLGKEFIDVHFESIFAENGVDLYTKAFLKYKNGFALSKTGLGVKSEGQLLISGTQGYILARSPWWLTNEFEVRYEDPNKIERYVANYLGSGLRYELSDFVHLINGNGNRAFKLTAGESIALARIMEQFMEERMRLRGDAK